jgi:hypothetical protein
VYKKRVVVNQELFGNEMEDEAVEQKPEVVN